MRQAVDDTSIDHTIESKVERLRSGPGEDLLTTAALEWRGHATVGAVATLTATW